MFRRSHLILFLNSTGLRAALVDRLGTRIEREETFLLDEAGLAGALNQVKEKFGQGGRFILPEAYLYATQIEVDLHESEVRTALEEKIADVFPETLGSIAWDYQLVRKTDQGTLIELVGVVKEFGDILKEALGNSHYSLQSLIPESAALAQLVPVDTKALVVAEQEEGWLIILVVNQQVVTSIFLDHIPTERDLSQVLTFGKERKQTEPEIILLSLTTTDPSTLPTLALPQTVLDRSLDPVLGAARMTFGRRDSERLDLPLRGTTGSWTGYVRDFFARIQ